MRVFQQMSTEHIGKSVVLLVEGENGTIGGACMSSQMMPTRGSGAESANVRVSAVSVTFFSPSASRKSSNLSRGSVFCWYDSIPQCKYPCAVTPSHVRDIFCDVSRGEQKQAYLSGAFISAASRTSLLRFLQYHQ